MTRPQDQTNEEWLADYDNRRAELEKPRNQEIDEMAIMAASKGGKEFEKLSQGAHMAVCDMLVNLGTQKTEWQGSVKYQPKIYIRFQVPAERIDINGEDKPMVIGEVFTLSLSEKSKLRPLLESWRGKGFTPEELEGFDITKLLGVACQLSVTHNTANNGKTYANITATMPIPKGVEPPKIEGSTTLFEGMNETPEVYESLPNWLKEKIDESAEEKIEPQSVAPIINDGPEDIIPF